MATAEATPSHELPLHPRRVLPGNEQRSFEGVLEQRGTGVHGAVETAAASRRAKWKPIRHSETLTASRRGNIPTGRQGGVDPSNAGTRRQRWQCRPRCLDLAAWPTLAERLTSPTSPVDSRRRAPRIYWLKAQSDYHDNHNQCLSKGSK